ncbi:hypothetical protein ACEOHC_003956 [Salmonella enterica]
MNSIEVRTERVTPDHAKWLLSFNKGNRHQVESHIDKLASLIKAGNFVNNAETIKFTGTPEHPERCIDGQHRLEAIVKSNCAVEVTIAYNVPLTAAPTIDAGKGRTNGDRVMFELEGLTANQARDVGAVIPYLIIYERETINVWIQNGSGTALFTTPQAVVAYAQKNKAELLDAWNWCDKNLRPTRKPLRPMPEMVFYRVVMKRIDPAMADAFLLTVFAGLNCQANSVQFALRNWLLNLGNKTEDKAPMHIIRFTVAHAWNRVRTGNARVTTMRTIKHSPDMKVERFL